MSSSQARRVHVGVFNRIKTADRAVAALVDAGFDKEHITVICPTCTREKYEEYQKREPAGSHTAAAATGGGAIGAFLGGLVAAVAVAASGGTGLLIAGPLIAGSGGGAVIGGFVGAMLTRGVEHEVADFYDQALQKGQVLVAVELEEPGSDARLANADRIFSELGGENVVLRQS